MGGHSLSKQLFKNLCRIVSFPAITVANCHAFKRVVALGLGPVPMQFLPFAAKNLSHRVAGWQRDTNSVAPLCTGKRRIDKVVSVAKVHGAEVYRNFSFSRHAPLRRLFRPTQAVAA